MICSLEQQLVLTNSGIDSSDGRIRFEHRWAGPERQNNQNVSKSSYCRSTPLGGSCPMRLWYNIDWRGIVTHQGVYVAIWYVSTPSQNYILFHEASGTLLTVFRRLRLGIIQECGLDLPGWVLPVRHPFGQKGLVVSWTTRTWLKKESVELSRPHLNGNPDRVVVSRREDVVSVVSGGENGGHEMRTSYGRIFIQNRDPLDHRYQTAWKAKD